MPKGDTYIELKRYLENCGFDKITMTFEQIADIVGELPPSAYDHTAVWYDGHGGPLSQSWLDAGYTSSAVIKGKQVTFSKIDYARENESKQIIKQNRITTQPIFTVKLDIDTAVQSIRKFHGTTKEGEHTRYRSWAHCYKAFREYRHDEKNLDLLCLHLAWYMASWGMLRGGSFLLRMDYLVHKPLIETVLSGKYDLLFRDEHGSHMIPIILEFANEISEAYGSRPLTDTFVTKIILGIFGCTPAYDRFFKYAARKFKLCSGSLNENSLESLWRYYEEHNQAFEALRAELSIEGQHYTPMKLIDMCLFQIGVDELEQEEDE